MGGAITGAVPPSLLEQAVSTTTAAGDIVLRTAAATLLSATFAPVALSKSAVAFEREQLDFYRSRIGDRARVFIDPPPDVHVRARKIIPPPWAMGVGRVDRLTFESPFETLNPALRAAYAGHKRNRIARAQHWRHTDGPHPTIVVLHGFMGSPALFNSAFFSLPWFYGNGCDVVLVTLPFHGPRADWCSPYSGAGFFGNGLAHVNEAVLQAVSDVRALVGYLLGTGVPRVGVTGLSLGGYTTAVLAATEPRLHFAIPNAPVTDLASVVKTWIPAGQLLELSLKLRSIDFDGLAESLSVTSPLRYPPVLAHDRLFIIGGLGDRLAPPVHATRLWEHWDRCHIHWYPGNHVMHVNRGAYLREMGRFLRTTGFSSIAGADLNGNGASPVHAAR
jgi:hypothetical protein